jgi:MFS family permease
LAFGLLTIYLAGAAWFDGFVFARCLEGLAQGTFFVCSVMTTLTLFPPKLRGLAYSVFGVTSLSGAASGAFIGGWFLDHAFWRDAMLAYALSAMFVGIVIWKLLEAPGAKSEARFDVPGIAFVFVAFLSYQYIAAFGERRDWLASPDIAAIVFVAPVIILFVLADKINLKVPITIGFIIVPVSYAMLALFTTSDSDLSTFVLAIVLSGAGFACLFTPIATLLIRSLPEDVRAEGIAIFKLVLLLGGSIATTVLGVIYDHSLAGFTSLLTGEASLRHFTQAGVLHPTVGVLALVGQQAAVLTFADNSKVVSLMTLLNLPFVPLLQRLPSPSSAPVSPPHS